MKRSVTVQLVMLGASIGLPGCDDQARALQRQTYASQEDCRRDWGDPDDCRAATGAGGGYYLGPRYYWDPAQGRPVIVNPDGSTRVAVNSRVSAGGSTEGLTRAAGTFTRGGFGSIGHGLGGGE